MISARAIRRRIPELLDALAKDFVQHGYDLRHLIRTIMSSRVYQLASEPNATNAEDETNHSRALVRRLTAEQIARFDEQGARALALQIRRVPGRQRGSRRCRRGGSTTTRCKTDVDRFARGPSASRRG